MSRDPDFQPVGTVRYESQRSLDAEFGLGERCCIKRVEVVAVCESREEARQWMLNQKEAFEEALRA